jgi:hypothetical protein
MVVTVYRGETPCQVLVDDGDWQWFSSWTWHVSYHNYVYRIDPDRGFVRLHREVLGVRDKRVYVDHIDGNRLDNRRANLRQATPTQNAVNNGPKSCYAGKLRPSPHKGVSYRRGRWRMNILLPDGRRIDRVFLTDEAAARAYDELAFKHYGEWARLNFPLDQNGDGG